jgi:hypothetical protein
MGDRGEVSIHSELKGYLPPRRAIGGGHAAGAEHTFHTYHFTGLLPLKGQCITVTLSTPQEREVDKKTE